MNRTVRQWWRRRSVRLKLSAWYMAAMLAVLAVYAGCLLVVLKRADSQSLDERLRSDFRWATEMAEQRPDGTLTWFETSAVDEDMPWLQVWSPTGELLFKTAVVDRLPIQESGMLARHADNSIAVVKGTMPIRVLSGPAKVAGRPVVVQVARSEALLWANLRDMIVILLVSLPLAVATAGGGGYFLARRALAPVSLIAERTKAVTAERLNDRLPVDNERDELGRLSAVINQMLERLEQSFAQTRQFTADVSHQLRTPLTALRTEAEVALRSTHSADQYRAVIGSMLEEIDRLGGLVDQLLVLSRAETGEARLAVEDVDLALLASQVANHLAVLADEKGQTVSVRSEGSPRCRGDRSMLRQAVVNLLDNAIKYTPAGGNITLRVLTAKGGDAILEIVDSGCGIAADALERVFERFYRGHRSGQDPAGLGLGLWIARWAVEVNGGRLTVSNNQAGGATFRVALPEVRPA